LGSSGAGAIPSAVSIPISEACGVIFKIGEWVLRTACGEAATWQHPLAISVNVSAKGIDRTYKLAKKYNIKTAWGTDVLFSRAMAAQQGAILASLTRWYTPAEALAMATGTNAELLALSGKRNPYPGKLGVVEEGALADLLLVEGNPLENIDLVADPANNFKIIMKDRVIYKNTLTE
jgi:imidazolonepropionase-like amidohydrolase